MIKIWFKVDEERGKELDTLIYDGKNGIIFPWFSQYSDSLMRKMWELWRFYSFSENRINYDVAGEKIASFLFSFLKIFSLFFRGHSLCLFCPFFFFLFFLPFFSYWFFYRHKKYTTTHQHTNIIYFLFVRACIYT